MKSAMFSHNISNWIRILSESGAEYDMVYSQAGSYQDVAGLTIIQSCCVILSRLMREPSIPTVHQTSCLDRDIERAIDDRRGRGAFISSHLFDY
jgi:hypothetical protein